MYIILLNAHFNILQTAGQDTTAWMQKILIKEWCVSTDTAQHYQENIAHFLLILVVEFMTPVYPLVVLMVLPGVEQVWTPLATFWPMTPVPAPVLCQLVQWDLCPYFRHVYTLLLPIPMTLFSLYKKLKMYVWKWELDYISHEAWNR